MPKNANTKKEIGKRIVIIRESMNMSQTKFAELVDISVNFLSQIENGNRGLSGETTARISEKTGFSTDYILLGKTGDNVISPDSRNRIKEHLIKSMNILDEDI